MRYAKTIMRMAIVGLLVGACVLANAATAETLPTRKGGLWEQKTTMDQGDGPTNHTLKICIDEALEQKTAAESVKHQQANCKKYTIDKNDGKTTVEAECRFNKRPISSKTEMSGDFTTTFSIRIVSKTVVTEQGQSHSLTRTINQAGTYLGENCGDLKPGEAVGADDQKVMVQ